MEKLAFFTQVIQNKDKFSTMNLALKEPEIMETPFGNFTISGAKYDLRLPPRYGSILGQM